MINQAQGFPGSACGEGRCRAAALDHDDLKPQLARCLQLGKGGLSAAVLADDDVNPVLPQQFQFLVEAKGPAAQNAGGMGNGERRIDRIDAAHQIDMLGRAVDRRSFLPAGCQKHTPLVRSQRRNGLRHRLDAGPSVTLLRHPGRAFDFQERQAKARRRLSSVVRDARCKGMGSVDQKADVLPSQIVRKPIGATEAAGADVAGQGCRMLRAACKRQCNRQVSAQDKLFRQCPRLRRACQNEDMTFVQA